MLFIGKLIHFSFNTNDGLLEADITSTSRSKSTPFAMTCPNGQLHFILISVWLKFPRFDATQRRSTCRFFKANITVGQRNYFTTSATLLHQLPLLAVLFITGNNNVIFLTLPQYSVAVPYFTMCFRHIVKYVTCNSYFNCRKLFLIVSCLQISASDPFICVLNHKMHWINHY